MILGSVHVEGLMDRSLLNSDDTNLSEGNVRLWVIRTISFVKRAAVFESVIKTGP